MADTNETFENVEATDELPEGIVEESDDSEMTIDEAVAEETDGQAADEEPTEEAEPETPKAKEEPGYVKGRIEKAVTRAVAETEARMRAEFDQRMAPIMERLLTEDAKEMVRQGTIKDLETAKEYLRMKRGMAAPEAEAPAEQPRNANGQFAPKEQANDVATQARIDMLKHQADRIKANRGVDVIAEFKNNPDAKQRIINGEIDFYDLADEMSSKPKKSKPPTPMRSPNGAASDQQQNAIMDMSSDQFQALVRRVQGGARIRQK